MIHLCVVRVSIAQTAKSIYRCNNHVVGEAPFPSIFSTEPGKTFREVYFCCFCLIYSDLYGIAAPLFNYKMSKNYETQANMQLPYKLYKCSYMFHSLGFLKTYSEVNTSLPPFSWITILLKLSFDFMGFPKNRCVHP